MYQLSFVPGKILEIGGGDNPIRDDKGNRLSTNMDVRKSPNIDVVHDLEVFNWPFKDGEFENVFAQYVLEHISWRNIEKVLGEIYRVLKKGGKIVAFLPNTHEQCKRMINEGVNRGTVELLFGSQEFPNHGGVHKCGWSPGYAKELFIKAGFGKVDAFEHPVSSTDLIIEAFKMEKDDKIDEEEIFERRYFEDGDVGYREYRDFCTHYTTSRIILNCTPPIESFIDIGCGRGYVARIIENHGIRSAGMDVSKHCRDTRVIENYTLHDARKMPWPIKDKEYDFLFTENFLEHLNEKYLDDILHEIDRVSKRSMHGIHMTDLPIKEADEDIDKTHKIKQPKKWWEERFNKVIPGHRTVIEHPRFLEYDVWDKHPPISYAPEVPDALKKVNLGSFLDCFYYGWENIDILDLSGFAKAQAYIFKQHDVTKGLPYKDSEVDIVFSSHLLEHLTREEGAKLLQECYRVMKPGGIIRLSIPDTKMITQKYLDGKISDYRYVNTGVEKCIDDADAYYNLLLANHKTIYDKDSLMKLLERTGFVKVEQVSPFKSRSKIIQTQTTNCHHNLSVVLEAEKPGDVQKVVSPNQPGLLEVIST
jgi:predicted SAM-dependent methyltransferase